MHVFTALVRLLLPVLLLLPLPPIIILRVGFANFGGRVSDNSMGVLFLSVGEHDDHIRGTRYLPHVASEVFVV